MFSEEDREWLKGSPLQKRSEDINKVQEEDYDVIADAVPGFRERISVQEYKKMYAIFNSRNYGVKIEGIPEDMRNVLVPVADLVNHKSPAKSRWSYENDGKLGAGFYVKSTGETKKGE